MVYVVNLLYLYGLNTGVFVEFKFIECHSLIPLNLSNLHTYNFPEVDFFLYSLKCTVNNYFDFYLFIRIVRRDFNG
jgi:hypothetical protein